MPARRVYPNQIKMHYSYTISELAECCGVHKNTVRNWQRNGLMPIDDCRPALFQGATVRAFLKEQRASRKCPAIPGTIYCLSCRDRRRPALGMVDYLPKRVGSGNLRALCETCGTVMNRAIRFENIAREMPGCEVQNVEGHSSLNGQCNPSLNCDSDPEG